MYIRVQCTFIKYAHLNILFTNFYCLYAFKTKQKTSSSRRNWRTQVFSSEISRVPIVFHRFLLCCFVRIHITHHYRTCKVKVYGTMHRIIIVENNYIFMIRFYFVILTIHRVLDRRVTTMTTTTTYRASGTVLYYNEVLFFFFFFF